MPTNKQICLALGVLALILLKRHVRHLSRRTYGQQHQGELDGREAAALANGSADRFCRNSKQTPNVGPVGEYLEQGQQDDHLLGGAGKKLAASNWPGLELTSGGQYESGDSIELAIEFKRTR